MDDKINELDLDLEIDKRRAEFAGLEYESDVSEEENDYVIEKLFDADNIRIEQKMLSLKYIVDLMIGNFLETSPDFQRKSVWKENNRKSLLIESLMLRIPIPAFYFYENEDAIYQVIDGQQRLLTIYDYLHDRFKLTGLEYLVSCENKYFTELDIKYQQRIFRTQLAVNILDARSPKRVIYDIFRRVNTGGVSLNPQEMRNAICKERVRRFLQQGTKNSNYLLATRERIKDDRMDSQEMVLRFYAFYKAYDFNKKQINYNYSYVSEMLDEAIEDLNVKENSELYKISQLFDKAMGRCYDLFGKYCFSKIQLNNGIVERKLDYINKSLFSSFSVLLLDSEYDNLDLKIYQESALIKLAQSLEDNIYYNALTIGTGSRGSVYTNFYSSSEVLKSCIIK